MKYKGIELEGLDKKVKLSHSRVMETDEGTDWIDKLLLVTRPRSRRPGSTRSAPSAPSSIWTTRFATAA